METNRLFISYIGLGCTDFNKTQKLICLPKKVECDATVIDGVLVGSLSDICDDGCNSSSSYKIPIPPNGTFPLQFNFIDNNSADYKEPNTGWGDWINIEIKDLNNALVNSDLNTITTAFNNGFDGDQNYQNIILDASGIAATCFYAKVSAGSDVFTRFFEKEDCLPLIEIEAVPGSGKDCWNGYPGKTKTTSEGDDIEFKAKAYIRGTVKYAGANLSTKKERITLAPLELIPDWYAKYIINRVFAYKQVKINGVIYDTPDITIQPTSRTRKFQFAIEFERNCNSGKGGEELCN